MIEFILVMAVLAAVMAIASPILSGFFRGRKLESEARRFVALTRYGQSQAVSDGSPMVLWIDRTEGTYGLRPLDGDMFQGLPLQTSGLGQRSGFEGTNHIQRSFRLAEELRFELDITSRTNGRVANIRFQPDGSIDEASLTALQIFQENRDAARGEKRPSDIVWIVQSRDGSRYEITDETNALERLLPQAGLGGLYAR